MNNISDEGVKLEDAKNELGLIIGYEKLAKEINDVVAEDELKNANFKQHLQGVTAHKDAAVAAFQAKAEALVKAELDAATGMDIAKEISDVGVDLAGAVAALDTIIAKEEAAEQIDTDVAEDTYRTANFKQYLQEVKKHKGLALAAFQNKAENLVGVEEGKIKGVYDGAGINTIANVAKLDEAKAQLGIVQQSYDAVDNMMSKIKDEKWFSLTLGEGIGKCIVLTVGAKVEVAKKALQIVQDDISGKKKKTAKPVAEDAAKKAVEQAMDIRNIYDKYVPLQALIKDKVNESIELATQAVDAYNGAVENNQIDMNTLPTKI